MNHTFAYQPAECRNAYRISTGFE